MSHFRSVPPQAARLETTGAEEDVLILLAEREWTAFDRYRDRRIEGEALSRFAGAVSDRLETESSAARGVVARQVHRPDVPEWALPLLDTHMQQQVPITALTKFATFLRACISGGASVEYLGD